MHGISGGARNFAAFVGRMSRRQRRQPARAKAFGQSESRRIDIRCEYIAYGLRVFIERVWRD